MIVRMMPGCNDLVEDASAETSEKGGTFIGSGALTEQEVKDKVCKVRQRLLLNDLLCPPKNMNN